MISAGFLIVCAVTFLAFASTVQTNDEAVALIYLFLISLATFIVGVVIGLYALFKRHARVARNYYITINTNDDRRYQYWWASYNRRESILASIRNAQAYWR